MIKAAPFAISLEAPLPDAQEGEVKSSPLTFPDLRIFTNMIPVDK